MSLLHPLQILPPNKAMKPQASHLQTRVDYLLRLLQEEARLKQKGKKVCCTLKPFVGSQAPKACSQ